jgi:hypothetical protein
MLITYKSFNKLNFPVFPLESDNLEIADGILWLDNIVVDDRNMPGDTLGTRRLQTPFRTLHPLKKATPTLINMIRSPSRTYIDSRGVVFTYIKTVSARLKYKRIKKVELKDTFTRIWFAGFNFPFEVPRPPKAGNTWAGILYLHGFPWLLYNYSTEKLKETYRRI